MPSAITMTDKQFVSAGITILDDDKQPFTEKPEGAIINFSSSDEDVAKLTVADDGMNVTIGSGKVGTAIVTCDVTMPNGQKISDTLAVAVKNSAPGSINLTVGAPQEETE